MQNASTCFFGEGPGYSPGSHRSDHWCCERGAAQGLSSPSRFPLASSPQVHRFLPRTFLWKRLSWSSSLVAEGVSQLCYSSGLNPPPPVRPHSSPSLSEENSGVRCRGVTDRDMKARGPIGDSCSQSARTGAPHKTQHLQTTQLRRELAWSLPKCPVPPEEWFSRHHSQSAELPLKLEPEKLGPLRSQVTGSPP